MRLALVLSTASLLGAQSKQPKTGPADYHVHVKIDSVTLAAEYLVHSLPNAKATLIANDYLVVEAAFFGPLYSRLNMSPGNFSLRINGKGRLLTPELPGLVAQSIKFPGLRPHLDTTGSVVGRFPGDVNNRALTVTEVNQENQVEYRVRYASLPEGEHSLPRSGLLYFYYNGKTNDIHSLELLYDGPLGKSTVKLLP
ncbi:MAG TPA: hypothetical protein VNU44_20850 [Bryobacteraceae bacterium]|nr:hypothetical protein [Bryobacteraceae bacterium]